MCPIFERVNKPDNDDPSIFEAVDLAGEGGGQGIMSEVTLISDLADDPAQFTGRLIAHMWTSSLSWLN